ncbi:MAG: ribosomal RNA small subunit methyltransferase A [Planctomycetales bacterium]|nr:ribosomal RNA small subunit methyltransferase A [Planctomycetales bacterium]
MDPGSLQRVLAAADISADDYILEVGPGLGGLTRYLAAAARHVAAVELDKRLIAPLKQVLSPYPNVRIIQGDILALDPAGLIESPGYLVVANIPYYITSGLIRHLLEVRIKPSRIVLTLQREVAQRICAGPGRLSLLALSVQVYGQPQMKGRIPAEAFYPVPKVESAVLRIDLFEQPVVRSEHLEMFFRLVRAGFSQRRKTLRNALAGGMAWQPAEAEAVLRAAEIAPNRRAQTLSLEEWAELAAQIS